MRILKSLTIITIITVIQACSTSRVVISHDTDPSKYSYVVFWEKLTGDRELDDMIMAVQNQIAATKLTVVSKQEGLTKTILGESVLSPSIHISTEKWDGGHTYITITFWDYNTNQRIIVIKSSGIGLSISQDQNIALGAIQKKLNKIFGYKQ